MRHSLLLRLRLNPSPLWVIFEINFFRNLSAALLTAVFPLYLRSFVESDAAVGMVFFGGYLAAFFSDIYAAYLIETLKKRKALLLALFAFTAAFAVFATASSRTLIFPAFAIYQFMLSLFVFDIGLYIKHYSNYRELAENAGKLGSFGNIGWLVGPFLGALVAEHFGFKIVFLSSSAISLIALATFFFIRFQHEDVRFAHSSRLRENLREFFRNPNLRKTWLNNAGLGFIYSIWDFLPLLMMKLGAGIPLIGLTKTLMGVPQAIFEYPIGRLADRNTGERRIFIVGYALTAVFTLLLGMTTDIRTFIVFFFIAATGTSFLEMTRDSYFLRQIEEKDVEKLGVYRTSATLPYLAGQGLAVITLSLLPIEWLFILGGLGALVIFVPNAYFLKELKKVREIAE